MKLMRFRQANATARQRWYISNIGGGYVTVANNVTGVLLAANGCKFILWYQDS